MFTKLTYTRTYLWLNTHNNLIWNNLQDLIRNSIFQSLYTILGIYILFNSLLI